MKYIQTFDSKIQMNVINIEKVPLITFLGFYFNFSHYLDLFGNKSNIFDLIRKYYEDTLEDINDVDYYVNLIKENIHNFVDIEVRWTNSDNYYQNLINFRYPTADFLVFDSVDLISKDFINQFL